MTKNFTLARQLLLGALLLAYLACASRFVPSLWMLLKIDIVTPSAGLLTATGSGFLVLGVARSVFDARLGQYFLMLAALQLAIAASQIGNWGYRLSQAIVATLVFGVLVALLGAGLAYRSRFKD